MDPSVDGLEVIAAVRAACLAGDGQDPLDEETSLHLKHHGVDDDLLWLSGSDGFALRRGESVDLVVAPRERGRGLGRELAEHALAGDSPTAAWSHGDHPAAARVAAAHGLVRARDLWVMRRPADVPVPHAEVPEGVTVRGYLAGDDEAVLAVNAAAFAHHPEQGSMDAEDLADRMAEPWFDPAGLLVAVDRDDQVLGFHWTKQHDADTGEVYVVGIGPAAQGRGLGRVLTVAGLRHLEARGVREVLLYVESDNTAAVHLYSGIGFTHDQADTHVQYRR